VLRLLLAPQVIVRPVAAAVEAAAAVQVEAVAAAAAVGVAVAEDDSIRHTSRHFSQG